MKESQEIKEWYKEHRNPIEEARMAYARTKIEALGYDVKEDELKKCLTFVFKGNTIRLFPYTGWFTGKGIKDGRGLLKHIKQIQK